MNTTIPYQGGPYDGKQGPAFLRSGRPVMVQGAITEAQRLGCEHGVYRRYRNGQRVSSWSHHPEDILQWDPIQPKEG